MKKLRILSIVLLAIAIAGFPLWRLGVPYPDWAVRVNGILMLAAIFAAVFSTVKIAMRKK